LGQLADTPVHVVHLSSALGLEEVRAARARGVHVYVETCPQYLLLDERCYNAPGFEGAKYVLSPPLRTRDDVLALRQAVKNGEIDTIATDHCSFNFKGQKELGRDDFTKIPNGGPGIEHRPVVLYSAFVQSGAWSVTDFCRLLAENPAKLFGMYPRKGVLAVGSDADITVWDPEYMTVITAAAQQQNVDYTPYEGFEAKGMPKAVFVGGQLVAEYGQPTGVLAGNYVERHPN
jgi:dihydropyrimidinase